MSKINLLPWREARRKELQAQFNATIIVVALGAAAIWGLWRYHYTQLLEVENSKIAYIDVRISEVDKKIQQIKELEDKKQRLLSRMRAIEDLQGNRPLIVRLFDELVTILPEGVTLTKIVQQGQQITIEGLAQSNSKVSALMRNVENSEWIADPDLKIIQEKTIQESTVGGDRTTNSFLLSFVQKGTAAGDEA